jgi:glycosyltransferase involved in cell wall biosynthesis
MFILYPFPEPLPIKKARGVQVVNITQALARQGCQVDLIHSGTDNQAIYSHYGLKPTNGFNPVSITRTFKFVGLQIKSNKIFNKKLSYYIHHLDKKPDLIIARHLKTAYYLLRHHPDIPLLYDAHEIFVASTTNPANKNKLIKLESYTLNHATSLTAISEALADDIRQTYDIRKPIHIVRTATTVPASMPTKDWSQAGQHIIYTGSLYGWKGVDDIIRAAKHLEDDIKIKIIGGEQQQIEALKKELGPHQDKFVFIPFLPHEKIQEHLSEACIAILPNNPGSVSQWTSPLKLFEYLANGCAIISTDIPTIREIISESEALFYTSGSPEELAARIQEYTAKPEQTKATGKHNYQLAEKHSWDARAKQILDITRNT